MKPAVPIPTIEELKLMVTDVLGGKWFDDPDQPFDINFGSIRNDDEDKAEFEGDEDEILLLHENLFNDLTYIAWVQDGQMRALFWPATTDPGIFWREQPGRDGGVGAIREGYYELVYKLGKHGSREALVQHDRDRPFIVYRDNNRDEILTLDPGTTEKGWGFNYHYMGKNGLQVNKWSGGCNGSNNPSAITSIIQLVKKQRDVGLGDRVSYAMSRASWFRRLREDGDLQFAQEDYAIIRKLPWE